MFGLWLHRKSLYRHYLKDKTHCAHTQDADQWRQESTTDSAPERSMLLRKAVGTWRISGLLHITVTGSPADFPVCIFSLVDFIFCHVHV